TYDASTDACDGVDATFTTINGAYTAAVDTDTIFVCPGTYVEIQVDITKAITLQGSGAATTIIDGGGGTGLTNPGTLRVRTTTGDVTVDGFTIQNPTAKGAAVTGLRFGISAKSSAPVTYTFTNNIIKGMNNPAWGSDYGVYTDGPAAVETFVFQHNTVMETGSNPILIERHTGPTDVSYNTIYRGVYAGGLSAYFNFSHTGTAITSLQRVSYNTFHMSPDPGPYTSANGGSAISFVGAFTGGVAVGTFSNVEIAGNQIDELQAYRRGISVVNNAAAPGTTGEISNAVIQCNTISGPGTPQAGSYGIRLNGLITNPSIHNNAIDAVETAFAGLVQNTHVANGITLNENSFTNIGLYAIDWQSDVSFDAENNWYDDPSGPTEAGNPSGTGAAIGATGGPVGSPVLDYDPWLILGGDSDPGPCFVPEPPCTMDSECDDGVACNGAETCNTNTGTCTAGTAVDCSSLDDQCAVGLCTEPSGICIADPRPDGTVCDSGVACSIQDTCQGGACVANAPDSDGDGVCDANERAGLSLRKVRVTEPSRPLSDAWQVLGELDTTSSPGDFITAVTASGIEVILFHDGGPPLTQVNAFSFTAAQCQERSGSVRCKDSASRSKLIFRKRSAPDFFRVKIKIMGQDLTLPALAETPLSVSLRTTEAATLIDRGDDIGPVGCKLHGSTLQCRDVP
ncbi:MAG: hypothetical protein ABI629_17055, partial [bacterium]